MSQSLPHHVPGPRTVRPLAKGDRVVVIGAGPAGLTAAYLLAKAGHAVTVLEGDTIVGGISRTAQYKGFRFDIGGHRFFTKIQPVEDLWNEILGDDFISVPAHVPHPLRRQVLRLSAEGDERAERAGHHQRRPHRPQLPQGAASGPRRSRTISSSG